MNTWEEIFKTPSALKLYVLHTGYVRMNGDIHVNKKDPFRANMSKDERFNPVFSYLAVHPEQGLLLFDTGLSPSFAKGGRGNFGFLLGAMVKAKASPGMDVVSRIKKMGLDAGDIRHVFFSHLHLDHPSGLPAVREHADPVVHIDAAELSAARSFLSVFKGYITEHFAGIRIEPYVHWQRILPFEEVCDVFGDGSVFVVRTPGHTPGHNSFILNAVGGPVLMTFDAAQRQINLDEVIAPIGDYDAAKETLTCLKSYVDQYPRTRVFFSHDPDQLEKLNLAPKYYH